MHRLVELRSLIKERASINVLKGLLAEHLKQNTIKGRFHPLGFVSYNLGHVSDKEIIRLHIWEKSLAVQDKDLVIHDHIFDFQSAVLYGSINNETYLIDCGESQIKSSGYFYEVSYLEGRSELNRVKDNCSFQMVKSELVKEGSYYNVGHSEFHKSYCNSNFAITLLLTELVDGKKALVFSESDKGNLIEYEREELLEEENNRLLLKASKLLGKVERAKTTRPLSRPKLSQ